MRDHFELETKAGTLSSANVQTYFRNSFGKYLAANIKEAEQCEYFRVHEWRNMKDEELFGTFVNWALCQHPPFLSYLSPLSALA